MRIVDRTSDPVLWPRRRTLRLPARCRRLQLDEQRDRRSAQSLVYGHNRARRWERVHCGSRVSQRAGSAGPVRLRRAQTKALPTHPTRPGTPSPHDAARFSNHVQDSAKYRTPRTRLAFLAGSPSRTMRTWWTRGCGRRPRGPTSPWRFRLVNEYQESAPAGRPHNLASVSLSVCPIRTSVASAPMLARWEMARHRG